jgi:hypothetical protein
VGVTGDIKIYSATKLLPVQFGGFLVGMTIPFERMWHVHASYDLGKEEEILASIHAHWQPLDEIKARRRHNWKRYVDHLKSVADPYFELVPGIMPYAFLMKAPDEEMMKTVSAYVRSHHVEAGNWYHHAAVFLPCHQRMTDRHVDYVAGAVLANYREWCGLPRPGQEPHGHCFNNRPPKSAANLLPSQRRLQWKSSRNIGSSAKNASNPTGSITGSSGFRDWVGAQQPRAIPCSSASSI